MASAGARDAVPTWPRTIVLAAFESCRGRAHRVPVTSGKTAPPTAISPSGERVECRIEREADVTSVQYEARWLAERAGLPANDAIEFAIVAVELTTNILKYGKRGAVVLEVIDDAVRGLGARVTAFDEGPPFTDFERALSGWIRRERPHQRLALGRRRGIASGLGAVHRLSDRCGWASLEPADMPITRPPASVTSARHRPRPTRQARGAERWPRRRQR